MSKDVMTMIVSMIGLVLVPILGFFAWMAYRRFVQGKQTIVNNTTSFNDAEILNRISAAEERVLEYVRPALRTMAEDVQTLRRTLDTRITNVTNMQAASINDLRETITTLQNDIRNVRPQITTFMSEIRRGVTQQLQENREDRRSKDDTIYEYIKGEIGRIGEKIAYVDRQMVNHIVQMHNK